jgi:hypothetical protein
VGWFLLVGKSIDYRIFAKKLVNICPSWKTVQKLSDTWHVHKDFRARSS